MSTFHTMSCLVLFPIAKHFKMQHCGITKTSVAMLLVCNFAKLPQKEKAA
uniref:Uncharacterized protein n=1 Tax=Rhizophora mucronata TaxID=61149 RepID=A0A2P2NKH3_RHIMU